MSWRTVSCAVLRCLIWAVLALSLYWSARLAWADHLSRSARLADRETSVALAPVWAALYDRLADRRIDAGRDPVSALRRTVELEPEDPARAERLALYAELSGDLDLAERSLLASATRSRTYQPRYLLAQFYFRRGNENAFWPWANRALDVAPDDVQPLLDLCWRTRPEVTAGSPLIQRQWLIFLLRQQEDAAAYAQALRVAANAVDGDRRVLLEYIDAALAKGESAEALEIWNALCRGRLLPYAPSGYGTVTNATFARTPLGTGFDWRVERVPGVEMAATGNGLRVEFSGTQPEMCTLVWQYLPRRPGEHYRVVNRDLEGGLAWEMESARLRLVYRRPPGQQRFEGAARVSAPQIERIP